jgi:hypothetical protein
MGGPISILGDPRRLFSEKYVLYFWFILRSLTTYTVQYITYFKWFLFFFPGCERVHF